MKSRQLEYGALAIAVLGVLAACPPPTGSVETGGGAGGGSALTGGGDAHTGGGAATGGGTPSVTGGGGETGGGTALADGGQPTGGGVATIDGGAPRACTEVATNEFQLGTLLSQYAYVRATLSAPVGDPSVLDTVGIQFYFDSMSNGGALGTFDLSNETNGATCSRCVLAVQDYFSKPTRYFVTSGQLTMNTGSNVAQGIVSGALDNAYLDEAIISPGTYQTTFVPDGGCLHITHAAVNVTPPSTPFPVNPDGGCGEVEFGLFGDNGHISTPAGRFFRATELYPLLNSIATPDFAGVIITDAAIDAGLGTGTYDLSQNGEDNLGTCAHCVYMSVDATQTGAAYVFMANSGSISIDAGSTPMGGQILAKLSDVKLIEVTYDSTTKSTTPVVNGRCLHVTDATVTGR